MLFVFIYTYWCPTRLQYQMMFVSFNSNTTGDAIIGMYVHFIRYPWAIYVCHITSLQGLQCNVNNNWSE